MLRSALQYVGLAYSEEKLGSEFAGGFQPHRQATITAAAVSALKGEGVGVHMERVI